MSAITEKIASPVHREGLRGGPCLLAFSARWISLADRLHWLQNWPSNNSRSACAFSAYRTRSSSFQPRTLALRRSVSAIVAVMQPVCPAICERARREAECASAMMQARLEAAALWDSWHARACAAVDALAPPPEPLRTVSELSTSAADRPS